MTVQIYVMLSVIVYPILCGNDPRMEQGFPKGLMSVCPGSTKPAIIPKSQLRYLKFVVQGQGHSRQKYTYWTAQHMANDPRIDFKRKTMLLALGYLDSTNFPISSMLANEYETRGYNVIIVDNQRFATVHYYLCTGSRYGGWIACSKMTKESEEGQMKLHLASCYVRSRRTANPNLFNKCGLYCVRASRLMRPVGKHVAEVLAQLTTRGLDPAKLELLGFSLGGQTVSFIARNFQVITGRNISKITALEPSGPCFRTLEADDRLDSSNADFVEVIHTNIDGYGMATRMGHVDFYVNGGEYQPSELLMYPCVATCSHFRVLPLWVSALKNPKQFIAVKCDSIQQARDSDCYDRRPLETNVMGLRVNTSNHGIFYLSTSKGYPYYLGSNGLKSDYASWKRITNVNDGDEIEVYT